MTRNDDWLNLVEPLDGDTLFVSRNEWMLLILDGDDVMMGMYNPRIQKYDIMGMMLSQMGVPDYILQGVMSPRGVQSRIMDIEARLRVFSWPYRLVEESVLHRGVAQNTDFTRRVIECEGQEFVRPEAIEEQLRHLFKAERNINVHFEGRFRDART